MKLVILVIMQNFELIAMCVEQIIYKYVLKDEEFFEFFIETY